MVRSAEIAMFEGQSNVEVLTAFNRIPYGLINEEVDESANDLLTELTEICKYYKIYEEGISFPVEGSNGDYVPAELRYKLSSSLVNKEARFLFAEKPTISIEQKGTLGKPTKSDEESISVLNDLVETVLDENMFEDKLLKAAKDCLIGKRVACLVNFNEEDGITVTFLPSTQFLYETKVGNANVLSKFVAFVIVKDSTRLSEKVILKKKYTLEDGNVFLEEQLYNGAGVLLEETFKRSKVLLKSIPACVMINDGLSGQIDGESDINIIKDYERWYSRLSNADIDAERKSMNPIRYTVDMDVNSTKGLSSSAGSFWDLLSDQTLEKSAPSVGMLESSMSYSNSLKISLDRIKTVGYEQLDIPNVTLETMTGAITSGKALKAVYWPLIVRCKEKMKMWEPQLRKMVSIIIDGAHAYPNCAAKHISDQLVPIEYEVKVSQNNPLPEDEIEEKNMDLAEVDSKVMSRKAYMKKWRSLTDDEIEDELSQIALERQMIEDSMVLPPLDEGISQMSSGDLSNGSEEELIDESEEDVEEVIE